MKRIMSLILVLVFAFALCACGKKEEARCSVCGTEKNLYSTSSRNSFICRKCMFPSAK